MAKRKRLTPAAMVSQTPGLETKSMPFAPPPIAQVGGDAAATAALTEVSQALSEARAEGRLLQSLPLDKIDTNYLIRDRLETEAEDLEALKSSLAARGQTTPVEVADLGAGRYGLISGWRRIMALTQIGADHVLARITTPDTAQAAYVAMVEENEIRVNLTPYERAHIVHRALGEGLFDSEREALQTLYENVSRSKRSKIGSFVRVVRELGDQLRFPRDLSERQGLALSKALGTDPTAGSRLRAALSKAKAASPEAEANALARALTPKAPAKTAAPARPFQMHHDTGARQITITGDLVDADLARALDAFLAKQAKR